MVGRTGRLMLRTGHRLTARKASSRFVDQPSRYSQHR